MKLAFFQGCGCLMVQCKLRTIPCSVLFVQVRNFVNQGGSLSDAHKEWMTSTERANILAGRNGVQL